MDRGRDYAMNANVFRNNFNSLVAIPVNCMFGIFIAKVIRIPLNYIIIIVVVVFLPLHWE